MKTLCELRSEIGKTQEEVAKELGISTVAYHLYETGQRRVPKDKAEKLADLFSKDINEIFLPETFSIR